MKKIILFLFAVMQMFGMYAQNGSEVYDFKDWSSGYGGEYTSVLSSTVIQTISTGANVAIETAEFCGHSLNNRFAFSCDDELILSAAEGEGLLAQNAPGKKNTTIAVMGLHAGDKVTVEYTTNGIIQMTSGNAYYEKADGSLVEFTKKGKDNANNLSNNTNGMYGGTEYSFTMTEDGQMEFLSASTNGYIKFKRISIEPQKLRRIAYFYDSSYPGYKRVEDMLISYVESEMEDIGNKQIVDIDLNGDVNFITAESLRDYAMIVLSGAIKKEEPLAAVLKTAISYVPMLNLSSNLYESWGYGMAKETGTHTITIGEQARRHSLFISQNGETIVGEDHLFELYGEGANIVGYKNPATYFADDTVLAKVGDVNIIQIHNPTRNAYLFLPLTPENNNYYNDCLATLIPNAFSMLLKSARTIVPTMTPVATYTYQHRQTLVTLDCAIAGATIYYTTDGSDPTEQSAIFTEPFIVNEDNVTVKAMAKGDGYTFSDILAEVVELRTQLDIPTINVDEKDGSTIVTLESSDSETDIYYNYTGSNKVEASQLYSTPFRLSKHRTVTAFATRTGYVNSETVHQVVRVKGETVRIDTLAWMNSHDEAYGETREIFGVYDYYTNLKADSTLVPAYNEDGTPIVDENDEQIMSWIYTYQPTDSICYIDFGNGWAVGSQGQNITLSAEREINDKIGGKEETPLTIDDCGYTVGAFNLRNTNNLGDPSTAWLQTTEKLQGPFDINIWITGWATKKTNNEMELSISTDNKKWEVIDTVNTTQQRNIEKFTLSYEGKDQVYLRAKHARPAGAAQEKTLVFDILVLGHGEQSVAFESGTDGIMESVAVDMPKKTFIYNINGNQIGRLRPGVNIVKDIYADGTVKTQKVVIKE